MVQFCNIRMQMNISKNNRQELTDITTHTESNWDLSIGTIFGCGSGFGYGPQLRGVVFPLGDPGPKGERGWKGYKGAQGNYTLCFYYLNWFSQWELFHQKSFNVKITNKFMQSTDTVLFQDLQHRTKDNQGECVFM